MDSTSCYEDPPLCANGCGFFGNPAVSGLCTKCYRESLKKKETAASASSSAAVAATEEVGAAVDGSGSSSLQIPGQEAPQAVERCGNCAKRLKLLSRFVCRCEGTFCTAHRLPEKHACDFDFKTRGRAAIAKANPVVRASKLERLMKRQRRQRDFLFL